MLFSLKNGYPNLAIKRGNRKSIIMNKYLNYPNSRKFQWTSVFADILRKSPWNSWKHLSSPSLLENASEKAMQQLFFLKPIAPVAQVGQAWPARNPQKYPLKRKRKNVRKNPQINKNILFLCGDILVKMVPLSVQWFDSVEHTVCHENLRWVQGFST
jgi:hypothetical protein